MTPVKGSEPCVEDMLLVANRCFVRSLQKKKDMDFRQHYPAHTAESKDFSS